MKYVILADSNNVEPFKLPRQLSKINGESIIGRTIRLLLENGVPREDIIITSHDKRFNKFKVKRYEPLKNEYHGDSLESIKNSCWLDAFTWELIKEPITFLLGDVYFSDNAVKKIVNSDTEYVLFFCSNIKNGKGLKYIKHHDEPFGFKVKDYKAFKNAIKELKELHFSGKLKRGPIAWEVYRKLNGIEVNKHEFRENYIEINDITCDVDNVEDVKLIEEISNKVFLKLRAIENFTDKVENKYRVANKSEFIVDEERGKYLLNFKHKNKNIVELLEIIR